MKKQAFIFYPFLLVLLLLLFAGGLVYGAVSIPVESVVNILLGEGTERLAWQNIVLQSRFPQAVTALLAGASLAVSGLLLQTLFRNPLAGPSILGISDGANLGVAAIMLYFGGSLSMVTDLPISGYLAVIMAAFSGAACILGLIIYFSAKVKNNVMLLIIGIMIGYLASSLIDSELLCIDRQGACICDVGIGELLRGFLATAALFCWFYLYRIVIGHSFDQTPECIALRRNVCCQFRNQDQADAYSDPVVHGVAYCDYDCLLWSDLLYRAGGPACRTFDVGLIQS